MVVLWKVGTLVRDAAMAQGSLLSMGIIRFYNGIVQVATHTIRCRGCVFTVTDSKGRVTVLVPLPIGIYGKV